MSAPLDMKFHCYLQPRWLQELADMSSARASVMNCSHVSGKLGMQTLQEGASATTISRSTESQRCKRHAPRKTEDTDAQQTTFVQIPIPSKIARCISACDFMSEHSHSCVTKCALLTTKSCWPQDALSLPMPIIFCKCISTTYAEAFSMAGDRRDVLQPRQLFSHFGSQTSTSCVVSAEPINGGRRVANRGSKQIICSTFVRLFVLKMCLGTSTASPCDNIAVSHVGSANINVTNFAYDVQSEWMESPTSPCGQSIPIRCGALAAVGLTHFGHHRTWISYTVGNAHFHHHGYSCFPNQFTFLTGVAELVPDDHADNELTLEDVFKGF